MCFFCPESSVRKFKLCEWFKLKYAYLIKYRELKLFKYEGKVKIRHEFIEVLRQFIPKFVHLVQQAQNTTKFPNVGDVFK